jgi:ABC-type methionine transport system permease subunit
MKIAAVVVSASSGPIIGRILLSESDAELVEAITRTTMPLKFLSTISYFCNTML